MRIVVGLQGTMARKALAWSALLATTASLPSFSLGFVAPIPAPLLGEKGTQHAAHVALHRQERRHDRRVGRRDGLPGLSSSASGVDVAGDGTKGEDEGSLWAEKRFPGCSTVLSKATRLSGLLAEVWDTLADTSAVEAERPRVLLFPDCAAVGEARGLQNLYEHLEVCQDACEHFGTMVSIVPHPRGGKSGAPAPALVVQVVPGAGAGDDFGYDPDWDGDWDIDRSLLDDDEDEDGEGSGITAVDAVALSVVPSSDEEVTELTKAWVQAVITGMGVCPFSVDASRAGLPVGQVRYPVTREATAEAVYREYWREVELLVSETNEKALSTTLLITPEFSLNNAEAFEVIGQTLTQPLEALHLEDDIQLVFFHPQYAFRDGRDRIGSGDAANFARRSPFPMINILRTNQVRLAQKSIPTGLVYKQNEEVLEEVGAPDLQKMLEKRDWSGLEGMKVDRKRVDYYETARKLQGADAAVASPPAPAPSAAEVGKDGEDKEMEKYEETEEEDDDDEGGVSASSNAGSSTSKSGARASLAAAAGEMPSSFEKGFSSSGDDEEDEEEEGGEGEGGSGEEASGQASPEGAGAVTTATATPAAAAASSAGIADEDLRGVAAALVKRLGTGRPLKEDAFEEFSGAVDRILDSTAAET